MSCNCIVIPHGEGEILRCHEHLTEEERQQNIQWVRDYIRKMEQKDLSALRRAHPDHIDHVIVEDVSTEFFDALFVSKTIKCSCGKNLKIDREDYE